MIDLDEVVQNLSDDKVIDLVSKLGSDDYKDAGNAIIFKTICHNHEAEDSSMKLYYYKKNHLFHCYTDCGCSFNIIGLFKRRYELLGQEYNFYKDIVLPIAGEATFSEIKSGFNTAYKSDFAAFKKDDEVKVDIQTINKSILNIYTFYPTEEWLRNGISAQSMQDYDIKYSIDENKIIIPHYNPNGELIGIRGRALNEEDIAIGKYMPVVVEGKVLSHPLGYNVYGLNIVKDNIKDFKMAIVAESEKSCLQYSTMFGIENNICVAACGSSLSNYQVKQIMDAGAERILIAFDKEGEGWEGKEKYFKKLKSFCNRYKNFCRMGFIWDAKGLLDMKDSPFDKGKDVFLQLYKNAVWCN